MRDRRDTGPVLPGSAEVCADPGATRAHELLDRLPDAQREVLLLRVVAGLSAEQTAAAVGSTAGAVRLAQHRALARLRQLAVER